MIDDINIEIQQMCNDLLEEAKAIAQLPPVSHLSKSKIRFYGGIIGTIQDYREEKRLVKLLNAPICKGCSFYAYAFHLIDTTKRLLFFQCKSYSVKCNNCA